MPRNVRSVFIMGFVALLFIGVAQASGPSTVYFGGPILTMDERTPVVEALATNGSRVIAAGKLANMRWLIRPDTRMVDLAGRALMPAFVDAHTHIFNAAGALGLTLEQAQEELLENGITAVGNMFVKPEFLATMQGFAATGALKVRTSLYLSYNNPCGDVLGEWYLALPPQKNRSLRLRTPGVKVFTDGGSCNSPAVTFPYPDGSYGDLYFTGDELAEIIRHAQRAGYQVALHSSGDRSRDVALEALSDALGRAPNLFRHRIEHNSLIRPDQIPRYGGVTRMRRFLDSRPVVTIWGAAQTCWEEEGYGWRGVLPPEDLDWYWPWKDLLAANPGLHAAWHGDVRGGSELSEQSPLTGLWGFVTRRQVAEDGSICEPEPYMASQTLPVAQALRLMTWEGAYALGMDSAIGSLTAGKFADMVLLSADPLTVGADEIKDIQVLATAVGGEWLYCAAGVTLCSP